MKVRNKFVWLASLLLSTSLQAASGTPSTLRVLTDANGYLIVSAATQTLPLSQPTVFSNTRLQTDSNGYLQVALTGAITVSSITLTNGNTISGDLSGITGSTGFNLGQTTLAGDPSGATNWLMGRFGSGSNKIFLGARLAASGLNITYVSGANGVIRFAGGTGSGPISCTSGLDANCTTYFELDNTGAPAVANFVELVLNGIRSSLTTTSTDGLVLRNATAATSGVTVQMSPRIKLRGNAWNTSASKTVDFIIENLPSSAATPTGTLKFGYSLDGAALTYPMTLTSAGLLTASEFGATSNDGLTGFNLAASSTITWSSTSDPFGSAVAGIRRQTSSPPIVAATNGGGGLGGFRAVTYDTSGAGNTSSYSLNGANGAVYTVQLLSELTTIAASATTDTTIQMPANSVVLAVTTRVTTVIPTATSFSVGDSGSATRFSTANVSTAANSTDSGTKAGAYYNASALSVRLTMNGGTPADNTGRVRVTIYYYTVTPPTS